MRNTLLLLLINVFHIYAINSYSQKTILTLDLKDATVKEVLSQIEDQSEFFFLYNSKLVDVNRRTSLTVKDQKIDKILAELFDNTDVNYVIYDRQIILSPLEYVNGVLASSQQSQPVTGTVVDKNGEPLLGVTVIVKGTTQGAITDAQGKFTINAPADGVLVFSFVGMQTQEIAIAGRTTINVTMAEEVIGLAEVVAIGYGTARKGDLTGSVSTVSTRGFDMVPASTPLQVLQGRATGLQITTESGMPGAGASVLIRGIQSIQGSNSPVYVIDGMITDNIDRLNPNSIQSVSILKDASAAAIYGARAANGVILINTQRGSRKKDLEISLNSYYGFQNESNLKLKLLNAEQFIDLFTESYENAGMSLLWNQEDLDMYKGVDTNWKDLMLQTGIIQNYDLSLSGGSERSNYFISAAFLDQKGMVIETGYRKYTLNFNTDHTVADWIKLGNSLNIFSTSQSGSSDYYASALRQSPLRRAYEDDGDYGIVRNPNLEHIHRNPIWQAKETDNDNVNRELQGNLYLTLDIFKGLEFTARGSIDYSHSYTSSFIPGVSPHYGWEGSSINSVSKGSYETRHWISDFLLNYDKTFAKNHNIKALLGYSLEESIYEFLTGTRTGTPTNEIRFLNAGDPTSQLNTNGISDWAFTSIFGRLNYIYKQKYLFTATVRRDGTSRLCEGSKYGIFPSASVAWRISEESFLQNVDFINDLKLRISYGSLGNVLSVSTYATVPVLTSQNAVINQAPAKAYTLTSAVNKNLKWESTNKLNFGADITLLNNKLFSTVDYFIEDTYNLLFNEPIAYSNGLSGTPFINAGQVRNSGIELEIGHRGRKTDWTYEINFNLSHVKNEVVDLEGRDLRTSGIVEGYPVRSYFGYKSNGLIKDESELAIYQAGTFKTKGIGDIALIDIDGYDDDGNLKGIPDGKIDAADRTIIGSRYPDFIYGVVGSVSYKNLGLQIHFQGVQGVDLSIQPYGSYSMLMLMTGWARNEDARVLNRYHPTKNPNGTLPRLTKDDRGHNTQTSDFWLIDGSYLRIKNVNLSYNLPQRYCSKLKLQGFSLYSSIQNAFTFTKYDGPEVDTQQEPTGVPQPRTWTIGFKATF